MCWVSVFGLGAAPSGFSPKAFTRSPLMGLISHAPQLAGRQISFLEISLWSQGQGAAKAEGPHSTEGGGCVPSPAAAFSSVGSAWRLINVLALAGAFPGGLSG